MRKIATASPNDVLTKLRAMARADQLEGMARYGITVRNRLGVSVPDLRRIAKDAGRDHPLALALWKSGIEDARIVAALVADPNQLTEKAMETWVREFDSWDVCDQVCLNLFVRSPLAWRKAVEWARREEEFVRRAAFALMACLATHDADAPDARFVKLLPVIRQGADDERNYVKKAVSWALRGIGKRNKHLHRAALTLARELKESGDGAARWIGADATRELENAAVRKRLAAPQPSARRGLRKRS